MSQSDFDCECRLPRDNELVRVSSDPTHSGVETLVYDKDTGKWYMLTGQAKDVMKRERSDIAKDYMLFLAQNIDTEHFLWPVEMPVPNDHPVFVAMQNWVAYTNDIDAIKLEPSLRH